MNSYDDAERIARLERQVAVLYRHLGLNPDVEDASPSGLPPSVVIALRQGNKIEAIKLYREATGVGLKEAKEAIERGGLL